MNRKYQEFIGKSFEPPRIRMLVCLLVSGTMSVFAQSSAGDYTAGTDALATVTEEKMNNEEQDVKKSIMMIVGACIFLVAAAQALPLFFGVTA